MSMERPMQRNVNRHIKEHRVHPEHIGRLLPSEEGQKALTREWILPYKELIVEDAQKLRTQTDQTFSKDGEMRRRMKYWNKKYPVGLCNEIRNDVLDRITTGMLDRSLPGLQAMKNFVRSGGIVQPFWAVDNDNYFQNAIQVGDAILDVANDTVDPTKPPVVFYDSIAESPFKKLEDFTTYATIAEKYREYEIYPNIYLPALAPIFPVLTLQPARQTSEGVRPRTLTLATEAVDLWAKNLYDQEEGHLFGLSSNFLFKSAYSDKRIPDDLLENLFENKTLKRAQKLRPDLYRVTANPEEAQEAFNQFAISDNYWSLPANDRDVIWNECVEKATSLRKLGAKLNEFPLARGKD